MMQTLGYYDGKYDEIDKMVVPFDDRSHYYGDGVYDATCAGNHVIFNLMSMWIVFLTVQHC